MIKGSSGPAWLKEGGVTVVWAAAAVNVFLITWKVWWGVYQFPPMEAFQGSLSSPKGGFTPLTKGTPGKEGETLAKPGRFKLKSPAEQSAEEKARAKAEKTLEEAGGDQGLLE